MAKFVAVILHLISVFVFLFIQTRFISYVPLGSTVAFAASIYLRIKYVLYILGNCGHAEPRRASARHGETPLMLYTWYLVPGMYVYIYVQAQIHREPYFFLLGCVKRRSYMLIHVERTATP